jgi:cell division inhibitor SepF
MGVRDLWHRTLVYFGLAEDESYYDDDEDVQGAQETIDRNYRERANVRRIDRSRGRGSAEFDDIFREEHEAAPRRGGRRDAEGAQTAVMRQSAAQQQQQQTTAVRVHLIAPRSFNDAQQIADRFKVSVPVIINLQSAEPELSKRLIDFGSGLTYALDGAMQRIAEKVFLLTPKNVEVSAEDRARLVEQGFFNPT